MKAKLDQFEGVDLRYGQTLPRNYGGAKSPSNLEGSEEDEARRGAEIEELRNFKTPDLSQFEDQEKEIEVGLEERKSIVNYIYQVAENYV